MRGAELGAVVMTMKPPEGFWKMRHGEPVRMAARSRTHEVDQRWTLVMVVSLGSMATRLRFCQTRSVGVPSKKRGGGVLMFSMR